MRRILVCAVVLVWTAAAHAQAPAPEPATAAASPVKKPKKKRKAPAKKKKKPAPAPEPPPPPPPPPPPEPVPEPVPEPPPPVVEEPPPEPKAPKKEVVDLHFDATVVPPPDDLPPTFVLRLDPSWGYRRWVDSEMTSTDKHFGTPGVFLMGARAELYPFSRASSAGILRDVGLVGSYARAIGLQLKDFDTNTAIDASWFNYAAGLRLRLVGRTGRFHLGFSSGYEQWVFSFDSSIPPMREVPTARYSMFTGGLDARLWFGRFSVFAEGAYLQPFHVADLGSRSPYLPNGARGVFGIGVKVSTGVEIDAHATYTFVTMGLRSVPGRSDPPGRVLDHYIVSSLGLRFSL